MTVSFRLLAALAAVLWIASPAPADDCRYEDLLEKTVDAKGATRIRVDAAAGYLRIVGRPGLEQVRVKGTACASKKKLLEKIRLSVKRAGSEVRVEAEIDRGGFSLFGNGNARLDLEIEVPDSVPLDVNDSSGSIEISGVATRDVDYLAGTDYSEDKDKLDIFMPEGVAGAPVIALFGPTDPAVWAPRAGHMRLLRAMPMTDIHVEAVCAAIADLMGRS